MISKAERLSFILDYVRDIDHRVDVLNGLFVRSYINRTRAKHIIQAFGAPTCRQLGRDLSDLYKQSRLNRARVGLIAVETGFPKWVYVYSLRGKNDR